MLRLMLAIRIAVDAHDGQLDMIGMPYILAVMDMFEPDERIVAVLHDVLEDTDVSVRDLIRAGIAPRLCSAVEALTKRKGESLASYYLRVKRDPIALRVKYRDNLSRRRVSCLPRADQLRLKEKYRVALDTLRSE